MVGGGFASARACTWACSRNCPTSRRIDNAMTTVRCAFLWTPSRGPFGETWLEHGELDTFGVDFGLSDLARTHEKQRKASIRQFNAWRPYEAVGWSNAQASVNVNRVNVNGRSYVGSDSPRAAASALGSSYSIPLHGVSRNGMCMCVCVCVCMIARASCWLSAAGGLGLRIRLKCTYD